MTHEEKKYDILYALALNSPWGLSVKGYTVQNMDRDLVDECRNEGLVDIARQGRTHFLFITSKGIEEGKALRDKINEGNSDTGVIDDDAGFR